MKFQRELYTPELISEMVPLWKAHYAETAHYQDIPLDPELAVYDQAERTGALRIYSARQGKKLMGYQVFIVATNPHYRTSLQAVQDIVFMNKEARKGLSGYKFLKWCSDELLKEGVQVVYQHISAQHDFGSLLKRMGYELVDLVYGRKSCQQLSQFS